MRRRSRARLLVVLLLVGSLAGMAPSAASAATTTVTMGNSYTFTKAAVSVVRGGSVRWRNTSTIQPHDVTSALPGYFRSPGGPGGMGPGKIFARTFQQAGSFSYVCRVHRDEGMRGTVTVPITVTRSGNRFTIKVASSSTSGSPWRSKVQVRTPGSSSWTTVATTTAKSVSYTSSKPGTYQFRSAVRDRGTGAQSGWSPVVDKTR